MIFEKASNQDISKLTNLRIAYLQLSTIVIISLQELGGYVT